MIFKVIVVAEYESEAADVFDAVQEVIKMVRTDGRLCPVALRTEARES